MSRTWVSRRSATEPLEKTCGSSERLIFSAAAADALVVPATSRSPNARLWIAGSAPSAKATATAPAKVFRRVLASLTQVLRRMSATPSTCSTRITQLNDAAAALVIYGQAWLGDNCGAVTERGSMSHVGI